VIEESLLSPEDRTLRITISIGLAERLPLEDGLSLIKRADEALYASKKAGRNCIHWHDGQQSHLIASSETPTPLAQRPELEPHTVEA
jgi:diguanylate cyclase